MNCSPARLEANRRNAQKSTGPRTEEGKAISRANAWKHGLAGEGIALPTEEAAEVARVFATLRNEMGPDGEIAEALVRRIALLSIRLDRSVVQESAAISARVRSAGSDFDEARQAEVDRLMGRIEAEPASVVRQLLRSPEGVDRMVGIWEALKSDLVATAEDRWTASHRLMAENLTGRNPGDFGVTRVEALARAIRGDFAHLGADEGSGLDDRGRMAWARGRMAGLIDAEVARLRAHRDTIDLRSIEADRAGAAALCLFDPSPQGQLARRYEADAERGLYRALRTFRQVQAEAASTAPADTVVEAAPARAAASEVGATAAELLASFRAAEATGFLPVEAAPRRRPDPSKGRPLPPSRRDRPGPNAARDASMLVIGRG